MQGDNQSINGITATGYVGSHRYQDTYTVRLDTPKTVSLMMQTYNSYITRRSRSSESHRVRSTEFEAGETSENDSISVSITAYNYPNKQQHERGEGQQLLS